MKHTWFGRMGAETITQGQAFVSSVWGQRLVLCLIRGGFGFFLSRALIFEGWAPFGVGWAAASGGGYGGLAALIGVSFGYFSQAALEEPLKYIAVSFLVTAAAFVFKGTPLHRSPLFMPGVAAALSLFLGAVFVVGGTFAPERVFFLLTEVLLVFGSGYFYMLAMEPDTGEVAGMRRGVSVLVLMATLLLSMARFSLLGMVYPARIASSVFVLFIAFRNGAGLGSAAGLAAGAAMDLSLGYPYFSMSYGLSGLMAGLFKKGGRLPLAAAYVVVGAITALWAGTEALRAGSLLETFAASVLFMLLPIRSGARALGDASLEDISPRETEIGRRTQKRAKQRVTQYALAFHDLHRSLRSVFERETNDEAVGTVYDRVANRLCRRCAMRALCWDKEMGATYQALNDATGVMAQKGKAHPEDYPAYFSSRCAQFPLFCAAANEEMSALLARRQYRGKLDESRRQVCMQYAEISRVLNRLSDEMGEELHFNESAERRIRQALAAYGTEVEVTVLRSGENHRRVELEGENLGVLLDKAGEKLLSIISAHAGYAVGLPEQLGYEGAEKLIFPAVEPIRATVGVASKAKEGQKENGDHCSWYKDADGTACMILSDGMGSGEAAAQQSAQAVRLLERFLRSGIDAPGALSTLNSALVLQSSADTERLVTIDLCLCDMHTGRCRFYKSGASPSYVKRGGRVSGVYRQSLPAGVSLSPSPEHEVVNMRLEAGDFVVMVSDGVLAGQDGEWLECLLETAAMPSPKDLAVYLLEQAVLRGDGDDDMTVMVMKLE